MQKQEKKRVRSEISNIDNPAKLCEVNTPRSCISKNQVYRDFGLQFKDWTSYVNFLNSVPPYRHQHLIKLS